MTEDLKQNTPQNEAKPLASALNVNPVSKPSKPTTKPTQPKEVNAVKPISNPVDHLHMFDYSDAKQHVVKQGETLYDIAQDYGVALQQLRYFNHVNKATMRILPGRVIFVPTHAIHVPVGE